MRNRDQPLRVLHLLASPAPGGAEILVGELSAGLVREGVEAGVCFLSAAADLGNPTSFEERYLARLGDAGVPTFFLGEGRRRNPLASLLRLRALLRRFRPHVLHVHSPYGLLLCRLGATWRTGATLVYTHHGNTFRQNLPLTRALLGQCDALVAISRAAERLIGSLGFEAALIPNAVPDLDAAAPAGARGEEAAAADAVRVVSVGRFSFEKDYVTLVRAVAEIRRMRPDLLSRMTFTIIGEGPERPRVEEAIAGHGLEDKVILLGARGDVRQLLPGFDMLLMTSSEEGMPLALLEGLSAGLPIVATRVGGCVEIVEPGVNGFLAAPRDPADIAEKIVRVAEDAALRRSFAQASLQASREFSLSTNVERHIRLYEKLASA